MSLINLFWIVVLVLVLTFFLSFCFKKSSKFRVVFGIITLFLTLIFIIVLFIFSEGSSFYWWNIDTEKWSHFGSIMGAFLLAGTLLFQIKVFKRQQIEAKFFELIKYYRNNVSEMKIKNPFYYKDNNNEYGDEFIEGRIFFKGLFDQYKIAYRFLEDDYVCKENIFNTGPKDRRKWDDYKKTDEFKKEKCAVAYLILYLGVNKDTEKDFISYLSKLITKENAKILYNKFRDIYATYVIEEYYAPVYLKMLKTQEEINVLCPYIKSHIGETRFFEGYQFYLGHYFRHLYQAVNYIDKQPWWVFSKTSKYEYIKTLRAQMSNYELAIFFLNSLSSLGRKWESKNKLITNYNLVRNLPKHFIKDIEVDKVYPNVKYEWEDECRKISLIKVFFKRMFKKLTFNP